MTESRRSGAWGSVPRNATSDGCEDFESLYREHHSRVRWLLRARGIGEDALEDAVHDVFIAVHRRLPERDSTVSLPIWIARVARNIAFSKRRAHARRLRRAPPESTAVDPTDLHLEFERREALRTLQGFLDELKPSQREVFVFAELLGMSIPEIAEATSVPLNTLYSRLRLARTRFEAVVETRQDRRTELYRAASRERESDKRRRLALLVADLGRATRWARTIVGAAAGVTIGAAIATPLAWSPEPMRPRAIDSETLPSPPPTPVVATPMSPVPQVTEPISDRRTRDASPIRSVRPVEPRPNDVVHGLAADVDRLRQWHVDLRSGHAEAVLAAIAHERARVLEGPLAIDLLRLEHEASCRFGDLERLTQTRSDLSKRGATAPDCMPPSKTTADPILPGRQGRLSSSEH